VRPTDGDANGHGRTLARFVFVPVCGIIGFVRLTLTLGVQLHLVLIEERQRCRRSWGGIAGK
jgi:hypothetical protein